MKGSEFTLARYWSRKAVIRRMLPLSSPTLSTVSTLRRHRAGWRTSTSKLSFILGAQKAPPKRGKDYPGRKIKMKKPALTRKSRLF
jgi:hypothetical protein